MLDVMRWLERVGYHVWRTCNYIAGAEEETHTTADDADFVLPQ